MRTRSTLAAAGLGLTILAGSAHTQTPPAQPTPPAAATPEPDYATRPVAYIHGSVPVTRQDLGEFLIARGGAEKVELLVNKMIIEHECKKRGVTVTNKELEAALMDDLSGLSIKKEEFVKVVLPRYGKTLYEWMEDVVKPRLLLTKLCQDRVKVEEADLKIQFEREFGEKRRVQMIMWPPTDGWDSIQKQFEQLRKSQEEFDRAARAQGNAGLAAATGHIKPIGKHLPAQEKIVEETVFTMKVGDLSGVLKTSQGWMVMKLHEVIPPDPKAKWEDAKPRMMKQAFDEKMAQEIPKFFAELRKAADPKVVFDGPAIWRFETTAKQQAENLIRGVGDAAPVIQTGNTEPKK
jgi:hypothetical protein